MIYDVDSGRAVSAVPRGGETVAFSPDDQRLLTAGRDRFARLWVFTGTGDELAESATFRDGSPLWSATFAPDKRTVITTHLDGAIKRWDRNRLPDRLHLYRTPEMQWEGPIEFSSDGKGLFYNNDSLRLVHLGTGSVLRTLADRGEVFSVMVLSPDGNWLAAGNRRGRVDLWDTGEWQRRTLVEGTEDQTNKHAIDWLAFVPGSEGAVVVVERTGTFVAGTVRSNSLPIPSDILSRAAAMTFSSDRRIAALRLRENPGAMEVWELASGRRISVPNAHYQCAAFSDHARQFVAGSHDGIIRLWQTDTWGEPVLLVGHDGPVLSVAISADGRTVASAGEDTTIKLWHAATGRELLTFEPRLYHSNDGLRFSRDGTALAVSGAEGRNYSGPQVIIWRTVSESGDTRQ